VKRLPRPLIGLALLAATGAAYQALASARDRRRFPPPGQPVDVGGYQLQARFVGEGGPPVVIQGAGAGASLEWLAIQDEIAKATQVFVYDRGGYGWSDPGQQPRTADHVVEELHALVRAAGMAPPVVLVGHSLGGVFVRHYAHRFPEDVAGLVLVDSSHEDQLDRLPPAAREKMTRDVRMMGVARVLARLGIVRALASLGIGLGNVGRFIDSLPPESAGRGVDDHAAYQRLRHLLQ
jgi:pimeloyl-ACP methyl ester carboxylesterase